MTTTDSALTTINQNVDLELAEPTDSELSKVLSPDDFGSEIRRLSGVLGVAIDSDQLLGDRPALMNFLAQVAGQSRKNVGLAMYNLGRALIMARQLCQGSSNWVDWLQNNRDIIGVAPTRAYYLMATAIHFTPEQLSEVLFDAGALRALVNKRVPQEARLEAIQWVKDGVADKVSLDLVKEVFKEVCPQLLNPAKPQNDTKDSKPKHKPEAKNKLVDVTAQHVLEPASEPTNNQLLDDSTTNKLSELEIELEATKAKLAGVEHAWDTLKEEKRLTQKALEQRNIELAELAAIVESNSQANQSDAVDNVAIQNTEPTESKQQPSIKSEQIETLKQFANTYSTGVASARYTKQAIDFAVSVLEAESPEDLQALLAAVKARKAAKTNN